MQSMKQSNKQGSIQSFKQSFKGFKQSSDGDFRQGFWKGHNCLSQHLDPLHLSSVRFHRVCSFGPPAIHYLCWSLEWSGIHYQIIVVDDMTEVVKHSILKLFTDDSKLSKDIRWMLDQILGIWHWPKIPTWNSMMKKSSMENLSPQT